MQVCVLPFIVHGILVRVVAQLSVIHTHRPTLFETSQNWVFLAIVLKNGNKKTQKLVKSRTADTHKATRCTTYLLR